MNATAQTQTINGVTFTVNADKTVTVNGTAKTNTYFYFTNRKFVLKKPFSIVGCPSGGSDKTYYLLIYNIATKKYILNKNEGSVKVDISDDTTFDQFCIAVKKDTTVNNLLFKPMLTYDTVVDYDDYEPYTEQSTTLPYTLYAIPVSTGGNVTIDGQQYVADYVDVERGKLVRCIGKKTVNGTESYSREETWVDSAFVIYGFLTGGILYQDYFYIADIASDILTKNAAAAIANDGVIGIASAFNGLFICLGDEYNTIEKIKEYFSSNNTNVYYVLAAPTETDLTPEEIAAFKALATYYPVTNIEVSSDQLDGYTVFNYPISMAEGWNYVKQQIGDTRDYIYDMDLQSAEAYVNSEYAVALTELEVM